MFSFFRKKEQTPARLPFTTDVHSHLLPGIDDGSPDVEHSLQLVEGLMELGLERTVCTPHVIQDIYRNNAETIAAALAELRQGVADKGWDFEIAASPEYRLDEFFVEQRDANLLIPFPKDYLLLENSFYQPYMGIEGMLFDLQCKGFRPIMAHPERYGYYHASKAVYERIHAQGCLFQLNLLSFAGYYGSAPKQIAHYLLEKGLVDFVGTDTHHAEHLDAIRVYLSSKEYARIATKLSQLRNDSLYK